MRKIPFLIFLGCFWANAQQSTVASGGNATGSGGTVSFSVGQISYKSPDGTLVTDGVQQPYEIVTLGTDTLPALQLRAFPNPTQDALNLTTTDTEHPILGYTLTDLSGKLLQEQQKTEPGNIVLNLQSYPAGIYLLRVQTTKQKEKTFKIIKK